MMQTVKYPPRDLWPGLCRRNLPESDSIESRVASIIADVRTRGDDALVEYAGRFDHATIANVELPRHRLSEIAGKVQPRVRRAIEDAARNIEKFHRAQLMEPVDVYTAPGVRCVQRQVPITRVGLYIPGGRAPLFSTVLMLAVPARIAGCRQVVMCTPPDPDGGISPAIACAAITAGVDHVYLAGGAQAIAAMAYGTQTVTPVHKIFGPGNRYVTTAKQLVSLDVSIDMPAGPSEVMVLADHTAVAAYVAADLLSQAEHGPDSQAMLVTDSARFAAAVTDEIERQRASLPRTDCIDRSLAGSRAIVLESLDEMIGFANEYAPEHLILSVENPWQAAERITAAGSVFIGNYSPESAGDYASGTNHTLPTSGWARSCSGVNIDSYMKKITYQEISQDGLAGLAPVITTMAEAEGLDAHARAVHVRVGSAPSPLKGENGRDVDYDS